MFREMQDDEKETPEQGHNGKVQQRINGKFAPSVSKATLIKALDDYIMGMPSGEVCAKHGVPKSTFRNYRVRAGVDATGRQVRTSKVERWREVYEELGSVTAVKEICGGDRLTIIRELDIDITPPDTRPLREKLLPVEPERMTEAMTKRVAHLRSEVASEVPWVFPGCEEAIEKLQENPDPWWWVRLHWTIGEWAEQAGVI